MDRIARFPFPFTDDVYRYSNNSVPLDPPVCFDITPEYIEEITLKRELLSRHHARCFQALPGTLEAQWEIVELIISTMRRFATDHFHIEQQGNDITLRNLLTAQQERFTLGDTSSLPCAPLDFIGGHLQEDLILMGQKDGELYLEAGQLCFPANWSLAFDLGMSFPEIHSPIPGFFDNGLAEKIKTFIMRIESGKPWIRRNWSLTVGHHLATPLETFHLWGQERKNVTRENAGELVHLRVEVQKLFRLPRSNGILFTIHTHLLPVEELKKRREWLQRFYLVLKEMPSFISDYKGLTLYRDQLIQYVEDALGKESEVR